LLPKSVVAVILFNTDVSKMSLNEKQNEKIQKYIIDYVQKGGALFATHDSIYRRVRNSLFENEYRCQITNFQRDDKPIEYIINDEYLNCTLFKGITSIFPLLDGEVCWGNWGMDVKVLCSSKKMYNHKKSIPLLTFIKSNKGGYFWINSGDTFEKPCDSIYIPELPLITIIDNLIYNRDEIISSLQS
jgi:hypothetical protein